MKRGMVANGIRKEFVQVIDLQIERFAPINRKTLSITGRPGGVPQGFETGVRQITAVIEFEARDHEHWQRRLDEVMSWLLAEDPYELQFDQENQWTYFAELEGGIDTKEIVTYGQVTLTWTCADPYKYGYNKIIPVKSDGTVSVNNAGTTKTYPRISATVKANQRITHIQVYDPNSDKYFQIGAPGPIGTITRDKEERLLNDRADTLIGWATSGNTVDGGVVAGTFQSNGFSLSASGYGTGTQWHGPAIRKEVPGAPLKDFKIRIGIIMTNPNIDARGRLEFYMRDAQGRTIGKFGMKRTGGGAYGNSIEGRAGGESDFKFFAASSGTKGIEWRDFRGVMELTRINNEWRMYVARVDPVTKKHSARYTSPIYRDFGQKYAAGLTQIMLHVGQSGTIQPVDMFFTSIEIYRINAITQMEIPSMAQGGDELVMDFRTKEILLNGEPRKDLKAFGANFFGLETGKHQLRMAPANQLENMKLEVREGYL